MRMRRKTVLFNDLWDLWRGWIRRRLHINQYEDEKFEMMAHLVVVNTIRRNILPRFFITLVASGYSGETVDGHRCLSARTRSLARKA